MSFPPVPRARRSGSAVLVSAGVWLIVLCTVVFTLKAMQHHRAAVARDPIPAPTGPYVLDPHIREAGAQIGLTPDQLAELHVQFDSPWPKAQAIGMYLSHARVIIINPQYADDGVSDLAGVIAYEYMHDVWSRQSHPAGLTSWMDAVVATDPAVANRLNETLALDGTTDLRYTELLSITCTQTRDAQLGPELVAYCDQALPGRRSLPLADFLY